MLDYLNILKAVETEAKKAERYDFIESISVGCKYYKNESNYNENLTMKNYNDLQFELDSAKELISQYKSEIMKGDNHNEKNLTETCCIQQCAR